MVLIARVRPPALLKLPCQVRHATLIKRPKRPYEFTQLVTLTDGSTFLHRTTSPQPIYRSTKDVRNHPLWNPSSQQLKNVEEDEAGRLARFRERFGRGWDAENTQSLDDLANEELKQREDEQKEEESLLDLISGYQAPGKSAAKSGGKKKKKKK